MRWITDERLTWHRFQPEATLMIRSRGGGEGERNSKRDFCTKAFLITVIEGETLLFFFPLYFIRSIIAYAEANYFEESIANEL